VLRYGLEGRQRLVRAWFEVAGDLVLSMDEILDLHPDALLVRFTNSGKGRTSGGTFGIQFLLLRAAGADGRRRLQAPPPPVWSTTSRMVPSPVANSGHGGG
jgi:hypothetical protein